MTSNHHGPYALGHTRATMAGTTGCEGAIRSESLKAGLSWNRGLQLVPVNMELLVIADQPRRGEYVPGPCTHRPSSHGSWQHPKSVTQPAREGAAEGGAGDWG